MYLDARRPRVRRRPWQRRHHDARADLVPGRGRHRQLLRPFVLVANPVDVTTQIDGRDFLLTDRHGRCTRNYAVAPTSRFNIWVDQVDPRAGRRRRLDDRLGRPTACRSWWSARCGGRDRRQPPGTKRTTRPASRRPARQWGLAEGEQGGATPRGDLHADREHDARPRRRARDAGLRERRDCRAVVHDRPDEPLQRGCRDDVPPRPPMRFGAIVESMGSAPMPIVVERSMYWDAGGRRVGGRHQRRGHKTPVATGAPQFQR